MKGISKRLLILLLLIGGISFSDLYLRLENDNRQLKVNYVNKKHMYLCENTKLRKTMILKCHTRSYIGST